MIAENAVRAISDEDGFDWETRYHLAMQALLGKSDRSTNENAQAIPFHWAHTLDSSASEIREIVEGVLTRGGMGVLYGESNSGKSYLAVHLAICISEGIPWLGRQVECGAVVYVAAEGAQSVKQRLAAYRKRHSAKLDRFGLIPTALNLLDGEEHVEQLIELIKERQAEVGDPMQLVVVDTVARAMAGSDENSGLEMGRLVKAGDQIREVTGAAVLWVHHSGKDRQKGARGHSSLRAAADTEILVEAESGLHVATVTKQRDLSTLGNKVAARFVPVQLASNQWGKPITACVVEDAPVPEPRVKAKRLGDKQVMVLTYLKSIAKPVKPADIAKAVAGEGPIDRAIYGAVDRLVDAGIVQRLEDQTVQARRE